MNRLIIIGNGFDVAHGLKTRYSDFLVAYLKECIVQANGGAGVKKYRDSILEINMNTTTFYTTFSQMMERIDSIISFEAVMMEYDWSISYNSDLFESIYKKCLNDRWVDMEKIYYEALIVAYKKGVLKGVHDEVEVINREWDALKEKVAIYMQNMDVDLSASKYFIQSEEIKELFLRGTIANMSDEELQAYNTRLSAFPSMNTAVEKTIMLNFNYTSTVSHYAKKLKDGNFTEIKIHGTTKDPRNVVFGFGDELSTDYKEIENLEDNRYLENFKSFKLF